jgi:hypothetical protein
VRAQAAFSDSPRSGERRREEKTFAQKITKDTKTDQELGFRHDHLGGPSASANSPRLPPELKRGSDEASRIYRPAARTASGAVEITRRVRGKTFSQKIAKITRTMPWMKRADVWNNLSTGTGVGWCSKLVSLCDLCGLLFKKFLGVFVG